MKLARSAAALATLGIAAPLLLAAPVPEAESNGAAVNNSLGTAQFIPAASFTPNADLSVFGTFLTASIRGHGGGSDVDFFSFFAPAGSAYFDIDGAASGFDTYIALFSAAGTLLADNDDSFPADPGSATDLDAFLGVVTLPAAGVYFVAVSRSGNPASATFTGTNFAELLRPDGVFGGFAFADSTPGDSSFMESGPQAGDAYTLHISVPSPGPLTTVLAALALAARRRRR